MLKEMERQDGVVASDFMTSHVLTLLTDSKLKFFRCQKKITQHNFRLSVVIVLL